MMSLWKGRIESRSNNRHRIPKPLLDRLIEEVSARTGVTRCELLSSDQDRVTAYARQEIMYRLRQERTLGGEPRFSYPEIGRAVGRDHSTVMYGIRAFKARMISEDPDAQSWAA